MLPYLKLFFGNASSSSPMGRKNREAISVARERVASLINASPEEVYFTSGGTESNNHGIRGVALANQKKGRHIITTAVEHPAVTEVCNYLASLGWEISFLPVNSQGRINPEEVTRSIRPDTTLISVMHANNEVGSVQPIREIGANARQHGISFHTDAAQSVGKIETDVNKLEVDLLSIAGHKLYAPKGIGALYIRQGTRVEKLMHGANQEKGVRPGTENVPYIVALGKACQIAERDFEMNARTMRSAKLRLLNGLRARLEGGIQVISPSTRCLPNTVSIAFKGIEAHKLVDSLSGQVSISAGSACHADSVEVSAVLKAMHIEKISALGTIRISTGKYTTHDEIDLAIQIISGAVQGLGARTGANEQPSSI